MPRVTAAPRTEVEILESVWTAQADGHVGDLEWSADGSRLAAAVGEGPIVILDGATGARLATHAGHRIGTADIAWHPSDSVLASIGQDGRARLWTTETESAVQELETGAAWGQRVAWRPDGRWLATAAGRELRVWDRDGAMVAGLQNQASSIADVAWDPDGTRLATAGYGGVTVCRPGTERPGRVYAFPGSALAVAWDAAGAHLAAGYQDASVHYWVAVTGEDLGMWGYATKVVLVTWEHTGRYLITAGGQHVVAWDCSGRGPAGRTPIDLVAHEDYVSRLACQKRGDLLASGGYDGRLAVWRLRRRQPPLALLTLGEPVTSLAWSPDDRFLAYGLADGTTGVLRV